MKTLIPSEGEIVRQWHVVDAADQVLGRIASAAAMILMGKHKPTYTTFLDTGDHVIVINAAKVKLTGRKDEQKFIAATPVIRAASPKSAPPKCAPRAPPE
jgi:large subunit ribosomal protein L13